MANRRFIDFPIAASVGNNDIVLIWQDGLNKQTTKATLLQGSPQSLAGLTDVDIAALTNGQILQYNSTTSKWENVDRTDIFLSQLGDVTIVAPSNGQVLVYNSSTSKWENSSGGYVPYTGAVTTVNLGSQTIQAGSFVKTGGTAAQFLKANGSIDSTAYGTGSVTSVALTMPSAFSVANSPVTTAGTLAVTGAGLVSQYIRGDGSLADFPATTGGGSSVSYYLNGSVSQGTIGGVAYKELNRTPVFGAGTDISISADGYIASFITDALDPNKLLIPAGNWNFETYFSASSSGGTPSFYVELYKYNGTTFTLIATSSSAPELIAFGTNLNPYFSTLAVPETVLALTDRLAIRYFVTHSGRTITLHTENDHLCQVITTFTTGLTALNGLTTQVQFFAVGTSGTDFAISSVTDTHTFNLPTASASNRGVLSSADWTTFNNKTSNLGTVTSVGLSSATSGVTIGSTPITTSGTITLAIATASGSQNGLLSSTDWTTFNGKQNALTNPVTGTGTTNYLPKFTGITSIANSIISEVSGAINIGTTASFTYGTLMVVQNSVSAPNYVRGLQIVHPNGTGATGGYISISNIGSNIGAIQVGTDALAGPLVVNPAGGNLLVGTTTDAGYKLDVNGTGRIGGTNSYNGFLIGSHPNNVGAAITNKGNANATIYSDNASTVLNAETNLFLRTGNTDRLTIASTGAATFSSSVTGQQGVNIGANALGTDRMFQVSGTAFTSGANQFASVINPTMGTLTTLYGLYLGINCTSATTGYGIYLEGSGGSITNKWGIYQSSSLDRNYFAGNVLIGTATAPSAIGVNDLLVIGKSGSASNAINFSNGSTTNWGYLLAESGKMVLGSGTSSNITFETNAGSERMRITSGGNVLIGTTSDGGQKFQVSGNSLITGETTIGNAAAATNLNVNINGVINKAGRIQFMESGTAKWLIGNGAASENGRFEIYDNINGTGVQLLRSATSWTTLSDERFKDIIEPIFVNDKLKNIRSVIGKYKTDKEGIRRNFLIAQDLLKVFPEVVDIDENNEKPMGVRYQDLIPILVSAIQELKQEIDNLKN